MIAVAMMAPCPRVLQVTTPALRLTAVFSVLAFCFLQLALGIVDLLFAFSVVIVIADHRSRRNCSAQERRIVGECERLGRLPTNDELQIRIRVEKRALRYDQRIGREGRSDEQ